MLVVVPLIFVADTEIIFDYNFLAPLKVLKSKYLILVIFNTFKTVLPKKLNWIFCFLEPSKHLKVKEVSMFFSSLLKVSINKVFSHQIKEKLKSQIFSLPKK